MTKAKLEMASNIIGLIYSTIKNDRSNSQIFLYKNIYKIKPLQPPDADYFCYDGFSF